MKYYTDMNDEAKKQMWEEIAYWLSYSEEERATLKLPRFQKDIYEMYQIPESTYYYQLQNKEFMEKMVRIGLTRAKKMLPKILQNLEKNIESGKEKSIEMGLKYILEIADRIDHSTLGEKIQSIVLTEEQRKRIAEETLQSYEDRTTSNSIEQGTPDTVLSDVRQELPSELAPSSDSTSTGTSGTRENQEVNNPDATTTWEESAS